MSTQLLLEERHVVLKNEINEKLQKKHVLELEITKQFEELKRVDFTREARSFARTVNSAKQCSFPFLTLRLGMRN